MVDTKLLKECRRHQNDRVGVEATRVRLVQVVLRQQFLYNQNDIAQVQVLLLQFFYLVYARDR